MTTMRKGKNGTAVFSRLKRSCAVFLAAALLVSLPVPAAAAGSSGGKDEVVYAMLNRDGSVGGTYVVNIFDKKGPIVDYGDYSSVRNMTTDDKITQDGTRVTVTNTGEKLYYEGKLKNPELPWNVSIRYFLDGQEYPAEKIAGKSGALTIKMRITQNPACDETFYKNYALQAAFSLDSDKCSNIKADGATVANAGGKKQLTYTVLPGKGADLTVTSDVTDFEMDAVAINGIRLNLNIQVDDAELMKKADELKDAVRQLDDGAGSLKNGASGLKDGTGRLVSGTDGLKSGSADLDRGVAALTDGIDQVQDGLNELNRKSSSLTSGSAQIKSALGRIQTALSKVSLSADQIRALVNASSGIKAGIGRISSSLGSLKSSVGYRQYKAALAARGLNVDTLKAGNAQAITNLRKQIAKLEQTYNAIKNIPGQETQAAQLKAQVDQLTNLVTLLEGNNAAIGGTETYLDGVSSAVSQLASGAAELNSQYAVFDSKIAQLGQALGGMLVDMTELSNGINTLAAKYSALDGGINAYTSGVAKLVSGYTGVVKGSSDLAGGSRALAEGSGTLSDGTNDLMDGVVQLYDGAAGLKSGTETFREKTSKIDTEISGQADEILSELTGGGSKPVSFVSGENTDVNSVQFVLKTGSIEVPETAVPAKKTAPALTVWQKFLKLFGLWKD